MTCAHTGLSAWRESPATFAKSPLPYPTAVDVDRSRRNAVPSRETVCLVGPCPAYALS